ncbi:hypothetical protein ZIOFF_062645 [Zingiber officinale]|uniref:Uncharacterized protein n=1 Tax=Zingiber officinale TaxID=94328 RepID=A0A8J5F5C7_ZINOF|nr:hypothetical protein ZIOFF_062645 [Zingiber officinale]
MGKKSKKHSLASPNEIQETIASHDLHGEEQIIDDKPYKKKGRGPSKLKMVSGQDKCKELERNELGQPIGDNSVKYASFLGCMIKEFVPYTLDGWNEIGEELNYKVEDWEKKVIFQKLAKLWRDRKSKLQILVREVNTGRAASLDLNLLKPEFMEQNQWDLFVKKTLSTTFQWILRWIPGV